jgi:putative transposase
MDRTVQIRKRMKRQDTPRGARFITFSCQRRLPLLSNPAIRDVFAASLAAARIRFHFELFAWVAMPEHVHLLLRPAADAPIDRALLFLKLSIAQRVIARWRELDAPILNRIATPDGPPRFWQKGGGFDRNVRDEGEFIRALRYIHWNPVKRGLVENPEAWEWSSARWWLGQRDEAVQCDPPPCIVRHPCQGPPT